MRRGDSHAARRFALVGAVIALGAPIGLLAIRLAEGSGPTLGVWMRGEIARDPALYAYVTLTTVAVMATFGHWMGAQEDRIARVSLTDELTGLWNRRHFERRLDEEIHRAQRYGAPLALLVIDVDRFKRVNDRFGHRAGDRVLQAIAETVRREFRKSDVVCRYGGEEIGVILPETDISEAGRLAERARLAVEMTIMPLPERWPTTISIGAAALARGEHLETDDLVQRADAALYAAKDAGRNRTRLAPAGEGAGALH